MSNLPTRFFIALLLTVTLCTFSSVVGPFTHSLRAQITYPYNGVYDERDGHYALTGATLHVGPGETRNGATLVVRGGRIEAVQQGTNVPAGAVEIDLEGKHVYVSFLDVYADYGMPEVKPGGGGWGDPPQRESKTEGAFSWNQALRSETDAADLFTIDKKAAEKLRKAGFGVVLTHHHDGISRGSGAVVSLAETSENEVILKPRASHHLSFSKGSSKQNYPSSRMGAIALLRQAYLDGDWYASGQNEETNLSVEAWNDLQDLPQIFETSNWQDALRADFVGDEFGKQYVIHGGGDEYQRLAALKASGATMIVPLVFPKAYDVGDPFGAELVSTAQLRHWERAPGNVAALIDADVPFLLTAHRQKKISDFPAALRKAVQYGADPARVLAALTTEPAELLGMTDDYGTLEPGRLANFFVTDKDFLLADGKILQHWVQGIPYAIEPLDNVVLADGYNMRVGRESFSATVSGTPGKQKLKIKPGSDTTAVEAEFSTKDGLWSLSFQPEGAPGFYRLNGYADSDGAWVGNGLDPEGNVVEFTAVPFSTDEAETEEDDEDEGDTPEYVSRLTYPNIGFGVVPGELPTGRFLIRGATVWTNEAAGILEKADVLVADGKIAGVGEQLSARGATVIDGTGMHLTSGIIDEHSHIALSSVNESAQASTAEVRMKDVVDATDENIYRQLAGGVTVSQLLHGSANPIGGQSAIVKMRWGKTAREMLFADADEFIKFALGENVKQSNWGDDYRSRFPQTRMGVEQVFESYFSRAAEYRDERARNPQARRDLDLEALLEILESERFISCHSYQQGEINMLMQVAERHGFRVNTFTHILEGYKVADKMAAHGAAGSTFSDWWAYKYEVNEAIPYNGAIMHENGVLTAFNSDDAEMARRLNQEAAKAVLFGGVSEEDAWKFVTLNPAKMLHLDDRVGSIKVGKDADLVLWNDHPLSIYARAERTFVDGVEYFNRERDREMREALREERNALIQKSLDAKTDGAATQPAEGKRRRLFHCNSLDHAETAHRH